VVGAKLGNDLRNSINLEWSSRAGVTHSDFKTPDHRELLTAAGSEQL